MLGRWTSRSSAVGWSLAGAFVAITAALAVVGRASEAAAALIALSYSVPVGGMSVHFGRIRAAVLLVASLGITLVVWPSAATTYRLGFLAFILVLGAAAIVLAPAFGRSLSSSLGSGKRRLAGASQESQNVVIDVSDPKQGQPLAGAKAGQTENPGEDEVVARPAPQPQQPIASQRTAPAPAQPQPQPQPHPQPQPQSHPQAQPQPHSVPRAPEFATSAQGEAALLSELFTFCRNSVRGAQMGVFFRSEADEMLAPAFSFGFESGDLAGVASKRGSGLVGIAAGMGSPQLRNDLDADIAEPDVTRLLYTRKALRSAMAVPVGVAGAEVGVVALYAARASAFVPQDVEVLRRACDIAAPMLTNIRTLTDLQEKVQEARTMIEMAGYVGPHGSLDDLMGFILETAKKMVGGEAASVMLTDPTTSELWIGRAEGLPAEVVEATKVAPGSGIAGWVAEHARPIILRDFPLDGGNGKVKWAVSVPLRDDGRVVGVLNIGSNDRDKKVSDDQMRMLLGLAVQAGASIRNARALGAMQELHLQTMRALVGALEQADPYGRGHSDNVARHASAIAVRMGLPDDEVKAIETAGMLHDVGKATLGEGLLRKDRPLTTVEQAAIQLHPSMSAELLQDVPMLAEILPAIAHHHERFDGGGYAQGLRGDEIPLAARILAVADAFDAMTSERAYRPARSVQEAAIELKQESGKQFDPNVVEVFREILSADPGLAENAGRKSSP